MHVYIQKKMCIYTCTHTHISTPPPTTPSLPTPLTTFVYKYLYVCERAQNLAVQECMYKRMFKNAYIYLHTHTSLIYIHVYVCIYSHTYMYAYISNTKIIY